MSSKQFLGFHTDDKPKDGAVLDEWRTRAACIDKSELFFADDRPSIVRKARQICETCPVITECLEYSLEYAEFGIWAGLTGNQRAKLRRERKKVASSTTEQAADRDTMRSHGEEVTGAGDAGGAR